MHCEDVMSIEAGIYGLQCERGADKERSSDHEHDGKCDFADGEHGAGFVLAEAGTGAATAFFEDWVEVSLGPLYGGNEAEEQCGDKRRCHGEQEDAPVDRD